LFLDITVLLKEYGVNFIFTQFLDPFNQSLDNITFHNKFRLEGFSESLFTLLTIIKRDRRVGGELDSFFGHELFFSHLGCA